MELALKIPGGHEIKSVAGMPTGGINTVEKVIVWGTTTLIITAIILSLIFFIWGGIGWITSGGDKAKLDAARKRIIFAVIGLIIVMLSFMIISVAGQILGIPRYYL